MINSYIKKKSSNKQPNFTPQEIRNKKEQTKHEVSRRKEIKSKEVNEIETKTARKNINETKLFFKKKIK